MLDSGQPLLDVPRDLVDLRKEQFAHRAVRWPRDVSVRRCQPLVAVREREAGRSDHQRGERALLARSGAVDGAMVLRCCGQLRRWFKLRGGREDGGLGTCNSARRRCGESGGERKRRKRGRCRRRLRHVVQDHLPHR